MAVYVGCHGVSNYYDKPMFLIGTFEGSDLVISKETFSEHVFYDIREKIHFTWKSGAIRGGIPVSILFRLFQASLF